MSSELDWEKSPERPRGFSFLLRWHRKRSHSEVKTSEVKKKSRRRKKQNIIANNENNSHSPSWLVRIKSFILTRLTFWCERNIKRRSLRRALTQILIISDWGTQWVRGRHLLDVLANDNEVNNGVGKAPGLWLSTDRSSLCLLIGKRKKEKDSPKRESDSLDQNPFFRCLYSVPKPIVFIQFHPHRSSSWVFI